MKVFISLIVVFILTFIAIDSNAEPNNELVLKITEVMKAKIPSWSEKDTLKYLSVAKNSGDYQAVFSIENGKMVRLKIMGDTVLIDGKDISGNLGNKTTHGSNSPIIETPINSPFTTGNNSPQIESLLYINIAKIGFPLSIALNFLLVFGIVHRRRFEKQIT